MFKYIQDAINTFLDISLGTNAKSVRDVGKKSGPELIIESELVKMTKLDIDHWAEKRGIKLDRRRTKAAMIDELKKHSHDFGFRII